MSQRLTIDAALSAKKGEEGASIYIVEKKTPPTPLIKKKTCLNMKALHGLNLVLLQVFLKL